MTQNSSPGAQGAVAGQNSPQGLAAETDRAAAARQAQTRAAVAYDAACKVQREAWHAWQAAPAGPTCEVALGLYRAACDYLDAVTAVYTRAVDASSKASLRAYVEAVEAQAGA